MSAKRYKCDAAEVERAIRNAIHGVPGIRELPEATYCEIVAEALDAVMTSIKMRAAELEEGD